MDYTLRTLGPPIDPRAHDPISAMNDKIQSLASDDKGKRGFRSPILIDATTMYHPITNTALSIRRGIIIRHYRQITRR